RRWLLVCLGLAMTAASLWVVLQTQAGWLRFLGVPGTLFFGLCFGYLLYRAVRPTAAVVLTRDGFTDHASALAFGFVAWNEVARIRAVTFMGQPMVCVTLRNPEVPLQRLRG